VSVRAGGHTLLRDVDVEIAPGEHVGIVGASGAGKSTLVGLLLGWHRASAGEVRVDDTLVTDAAWPALRRQIAWVDPTVRLWDDSLERNITYGAPSDDLGALGSVLARADLHSLVDRLGGLQTGLGEAGARLAGGEGQRVRFARAMMNGTARIVVLDEAFRGLDRAARRRLLEEARTRWPTQTLLAITHDVHDTLTFDRVLVVSDGQIVEDGNPQALAARPHSSYALLLAREREVWQLWSRADAWRRVALRDGQLLEGRTDVPHEDSANTLLARRQIS
jgi:ABC-type multidrug transport system fused ATPase/permease subunit